MDDYVPDKWIWSEADFEQMSWHDVGIHALAFRPSSYELLFDIDYLYRWVAPLAGETYYKFWVSPATLLFHNVYDIRFDLEPLDSICISGITRSEMDKPRNADSIGRDVDWLWTIECLDGEISFRATSFEQFTRGRPILQSQQRLSEQARGGFSFSCDTPA